MNNNSGDLNFHNKKMRQPPPVKFNPDPRYLQVLGAATCQEDQELVKSPKPSNITRSSSIAYCFPKKQAWGRHRHGPGNIYKVRPDSFRPHISVSQKVKYLFVSITYQIVTL